MPVKRFIVLANSVKNGEHCIAGKEIFICGDNVTYGSWIRPVSQNGDEGALSTAQCAFSNGHSPKIWEVVDVALKGPEGYGPQPENWIIDEDEEWSKVSMSGLQIAVPYDSPPNLWVDASQKIDRVFPPNLPKLGQKASLYLINPRNLELHIGWATYPGQQPRHRRRACFDYNGVFYDLALTDPAIEAKYCTPYPSQADGMRIVKLAKPDECAICVSLTRPFPMTGCHHKVVATVIE